MAKTKYSHKIDRVMISNRWIVPAYSRSADWTYLGVGQRYFSPKEYEIVISFFGINLRIWMKREVKR